MGFSFHLPFAFLAFAAFFWIVSRGHIHFLSFHGRFALFWWSLGLEALLQGFFSWKHSLSSPLLQASAFSSQSHPLYFCLLCFCLLTGDFVIRQVSLSLLGFLSFTFGDIQGGFIRTSRMLRFEMILQITLLGSCIVTYRAVELPRINM